MLQKIINIIFILSTFTLYSYGDNITEYNETNLLFPMNSQLSKFRAGQENLTNVFVKDFDIQLLRADVLLIRAKIERQMNFIDGKEEDIQNLRAIIEVFGRLIESLRADSQVFRADIQSLRAELEQQKKLDKEDIQSLRADLEKQNKDVLQKESHNQSLSAELKRQGKLVKRLVTESDKNSRFFNTQKCTEAKFSGIYDIVVPKFSSQPFQVACDAQTRDGGWTIILRRMDGSVNFNRNWREYKYGFGNLDGEYILGLDKIHAMTAERPQELLVLLEDFKGVQKFETYGEFAIGDENQQYKLHTLGRASGTAGDSFGWHRGMRFSTYDRDNDNWSKGNCALRDTGGWWYNECARCKLTGTYNNHHFEKGINWMGFRGLEYSLKKAIMMIRPKK